MTADSRSSHWREKSPSAAMVPCRYRSTKDPWFAQRAKDRLIDNGQAIEDRSSRCSRQGLALVITSNAHWGPFTNCQSLIRTGTRPALSGLGADITGHSKERYSYGPVDDLWSEEPWTTGGLQHPALAARRMRPNHYRTTSRRQSGEKAQGHS